MECPRFEREVERRKGGCGTGQLGAAFESAVAILGRAAFDLVNGDLMRGKVVGSTPHGTRYALCLTPCVKKGNKPPKCGKGQRGQKEKKAKTVALCENFSSWQERAGGRFCLQPKCHAQPEVGY